MIALLSCRSAYIVVIFCLVPGQLLAAGGTIKVATKGSTAVVSAGWPAGVDEIVNDPARTSGWNPWFTEWPNDVNHYGFAIANNDDLNRLIRKLVSVKAEVRQIRLSYLKEPQAMGWVTRLPEHNDIAVIFSIGDQSRIDQWFKHIRKPFGEMELLAAPVAVSPTLTIFVQNTAIDLDAVQIPRGITVLSGHVPGAFHRLNTKDETRRTEDAFRALLKESLDEASQVAAAKIIAFIKKHGAGDVDEP